MSKGSTSGLGIGVATLVVYFEVSLARDDLGRAERIVGELGRLAHHGRSLAIVTDDLAEWRVLCEAASIAGVSVPLDISLIHELTPDAADIVAFLSWPTKGTDAVREPHLPRVARAVRAEGLLVQVRDDLTALGAYCADHRILTREVRARNGGSR